MAADDSDSIYGGNPNNSNTQIRSDDYQNRYSNTNESAIERTQRAFFRQNMPSEALQALLDLIGQLQTRSVVAPEIEAQYPLLKPERIRSGYGYITVYTDPRNGQQYNEAEAARINAERQKIREQHTTVHEGGTPEMQFYSQARKDEIARNREQQGKYSKEAAMVDAKNMTGYFQRQMLEELMPTINATAEGAGTSKSSMRALQSQRAAEVTGEKAAALGGQLAVNYGNIWANLADTLEKLTKLDPNTSITHLLLRAIEGTRGAQEFGAEAGQTTRNRTSNTVESQLGSTNKQIDTQYYPSDDDVYSGYYQESAPPKPSQGGSGWYSIRASESQNPWADWDPYNQNYEDEVTF